MTDQNEPTDDELRAIQNQIDNESTFCIFKSLIRDPVYSFAIHPGENFKPKDIARFLYEISTSNIEDVVKASLMTMKESNPNLFNRVSVHYNKMLQDKRIIEPCDVHKLIGS